MLKIALCFVFTCSLFLSSCQMQQEKGLQDPSGITYISSSPSMDQTIANEAKQQTMQLKEIKDVHAIVLDHQLLVAPVLYHNDRFFLKRIEKDVRKNLKKQFPDYTIHVSTDKKIVLETTRLEQEIQRQTITKKELTKQYKKILKLKKRENE